MNRTTTRQVARRVLVGAATVCIVLWLVGIVISGVNYAEAFDAARVAPVDASVTEDVLGMPLFQGGRRLGRLDVQPGWGLLVMLIAPAVIGIVLSFIAAVTSAKREGRRA